MTKKSKIHSLLEFVQQQKQLDNLRALHKRVMEMIWKPSISPRSSVEECIATNDLVASSNLAGGSMGEQLDEEASAI